MHWRVRRGVFFIVSGTEITRSCISRELISIYRLSFVVNLSPFTVTYEYVEKETPLWQAWVREQDSGGSASRRGTSH
jgi:hypothetical protein